MKFNNSKKLYNIFSAFICFLIIFPVSAYAECFNGGYIEILKISPTEGTILKSGSAYTFNVDAKFNLNVSPPAKAWVGAYDTSTGINIAQQQNIVTLITRSGKLKLSLNADIETYDGNPIKQIGVVAVLSKDGYNCSGVADGLTYYTDISNQSGITNFPLMLPYDKSYINGGFCDVLYGKRHTGVDIMATVDTPVYPVCNGVIVKNNTNRNYGTNYLNYWNSFLIVKHNCNGREVYGYYGHIKSSLNENDQVYTGVPLGEVRESYNDKNIRTPGNDHLHFGININYFSDKWGYDKYTRNCELEDKGWIDPQTFFSW